MGWGANSRSREGAAQILLSNSRAPAVLRPAVRIVVAREVRRLQIRPDPRGRFGNASTVFPVERGRRRAFEPQQLAFGLPGGLPQALRYRADAQVLAVRGVAKIVAIGFMTPLKTDGVGSGGHRHGSQGLRRAESGALSGQHCGDVLLEWDRDRQREMAALGPNLQGKR